MEDAADGAPPGHAHDQQHNDMNHPDTYKRNTEKFRTNTDVEDIYKRWDRMIKAEELDTFLDFVGELVERNPVDDKKLKKAINELRRKYKLSPRKSQLLYVYNLMCEEGRIKAEDTPALRHLLCKKSSKSESGVLVITVLTSPYPKVDKKVQKFSCEWNCYYCPNEPGQPRSYLHDEPAVLRANANNFCPILQFTDRGQTLAMMGHPVDKIELLVLGGTWASYPHSYQEDFIRDLFYAANTFYVRDKREKLSLLEEQRINECNQCKIIGITLETRPDCINEGELRRFRQYGCTRVQLGLQHTDDAILKKINRGCTNSDAIRAIRLLKDGCFKVDIHLMPNLPGSDVEKDEAMFQKMLHDPDMQVDQWKIYPCEIVPWTVIRKWHSEGKYVPYADDVLTDLLMRVKAKVHPWIRLNRVVRDIPSQYILGGINSPNLRQDILGVMKRRGTPCHCIRCREVKDNQDAVQSSELCVREHEASHGKEYFISFETPDRMTICGFLRLRIPRLSTIPDENPGEDGIFPELQGCALVREVHVYGTLIPTTDGSNSAAQHVGFGRRMLEEAEAIARRHSLYKMAVISGVGARNYYKKFGYELVKAGTTKDGIKAHGDFQIKHISQSSNSRDNRFESKDQQQRREASHLKINDSASAKYSLATKVALAVAILLVLAFMRRKA